MGIKNFLEKDEELLFDTRCKYSLLDEYLVITNKQLLFISESFSKNLDPYFVSDNYNIKYAGVISGLMANTVLVGTTGGEEFEFKNVAKSNAEKIVKLIKEKRGLEEGKFEQNFRSINYIKKKREETNRWSNKLLVLGVTLILLAVSCWFIGRIFGFYN